MNQINMLQEEKLFPNHHNNFYNNYKIPKKVVKYTVKAFFKTNQ